VANLEKLTASLGQPDILQTGCLYESLKIKELQIGIGRGRVDPLGLVMGICGVRVRVDIQLPHPNPYPSQGYRRY